VPDKLDFQACETSRRAFLASALALSCLPSLAGAGEPSHLSGTSPSKGLAFARPASRWMEALPVGNGRLGAMVFGGIAQERLQLNHIELWAGRSVEDNPPQAAESLAAVRDLLFKGQRAEANRLAQARMMRGLNGTDFGTYQMLADLTLAFDHGDSADDYRRELDMANAMATASYRIGDAIYRRSVIASFPDKVLLIRLETTAEDGLAFELALTRAKDARLSHRDGVVWLAGKPEPFGVEFRACLDCEAPGGRVTPTANGLQVEGAKTALIRLTCETDMFAADPGARALAAMAAAKAKRWPRLRAAQRADHRALFDRVDLSLDAGTTPTAPASADVRPVDNRLIETYFNFGRYLLISSCRPGSLPPNLQGLWADGFDPPWQADYHVNINLQMNFWPAEVCGLGALHASLFDYAERLKPFGEETARRVYDCRGMVAHYTTNPWGHTAPDGSVQYGLWPGGLAWLALHFWEHYLYTADRQFLAARAAPFLEQAALFMLDYLVAHPATGKLVAGPSTSPENAYRLDDGQAGFIDMGCAMSQSMAFMVLSHAAEACETLGTKPEFAARCRSAIDRLDRLKIGEDGRILEWSEPLPEVEPGHRHISHLFGLYPGNEIDPARTPGLADAARKTIAARLAHGGGQTGWSAAWLIMYRARLLEGDDAFDMLHKLLTQSTAANLFDTHPGNPDPIFQIDGNLGATAAIVEMLVQSHGDHLRLLPALPRAWPAGRLSGVRARGGLVVDLAWRDGKVWSLALRPQKDVRITLVPPAGQALTRLVSGRTHLDTGGPLTLRAGRTYRL